ncbi:S8 family serine peptidase [Saccharothrix sp. ST-888]|uniref:S8 family serine peptidase n=1 Tax=Saccharothrix sp. ST-888 TaxID=1427391 RepID=UPI0018CFAC27|nr:S8 family serine peptidase [Saccharothrix sp. ST-888]
MSRGDGVIVALIDSGVDASHPDLSGQVLEGYDPSGTGLNTHPTDPHGTKMAGLIAAHGHGNGDGAVGLAPGVKILPIYKTTAGDTDAIPEDIKWAVDHQAKVINISLGNPIFKNPKMADAVAYAAKNDVLIVVAAGNEGNSSVSFPANEPGVLAVGAVDKNNNIWSRSNHGPEVMLTAPGVDIVGTGACDGGQYCIGPGTSDSTAYVSAAAALVRAKFPKLTAGQVANRLVKSALVPPSLSGAKLPDEHYGYGIIRPYEALTQDIPAGSAQGPLAKPAGAGDTGSGSQTPGATSPGGTTAGTAGPGSIGQPPVIKSSNAKSSTVLFAAALGVVFLAAVIAVIVVVSRRRKSGQSQPGQAPYGAQPYGAPQQYGTPPAWPQQAQPPYPNQPQPPYGNQVPPPGYPPQQPYQDNPYGQGGNQQH